MKTAKRLLALLLCLILTGSLLPAPALAEEPSEPAEIAEEGEIEMLPPHEEEETGDPEERKELSARAETLREGENTNANFVASGTCGENLTWTLDSAGKLTVSGTGEMTEAPWREDYQYEIRSAVLSSGVTNVGEYAFYSCGKLSAVTIPDSVVRIDNYAFTNCGKLSAVTIPNGVASIGYYAFHKCGSLQSLTIPASVTTIRGTPFAFCGSLREIKVASGNRAYTSVDGVLFSKDEKSLLTFPAGREGSYSVPGSVTAIGDSAFSGCGGLSSLSLPAGLTSIGDSAFSGCASLREILVASGNSVYKSVDGVLLSRDGKTLLRCPSGKTGEYAVPGGVVTIPDWAFKECGLSAVTLPSSVTDIETFAFDNCDGLRSIQVASGNSAYKSVDGVLFSRDGKTLLRCPCGKTGEYAIPGGVADIGDWSFYHCCSLSALSIPGSVTRIGNCALQFCGSLTELAIPAAVTEIGASAFESCCGLESVWFLGDAPAEVSHRVFQYVTTTVYYPQGNTTWTEEQRQRYSGDPLTVTAPKPSITAQPKSVTVSAGSTASFTVEASGGNLSYQWYFKAPHSDWAKCASGGYNTKTYSVTATAARNGYQYYCKVTNSAGSASTYAVTLTVKEVSKPAITTQPKSVTVTEGSTAKFTVAAGGTGMSYQWQWRSGESGTWANSSREGNRTATLSVPATAARNGQQYRCAVSNSAGTVYSSAATLNVISKPAITTQPKSMSAAEGGTASFTVTASGAGLRYQWQWSADKGATWKDSSSATAGYNTAVLKVAATAARNGYQYRCKVTNSAGSVTSNAATLTVGTKPTVTKHPQSVAMSVGDLAVFSVTASGEGLSYQWQYRTGSTGTWKDCTSGAGCKSKNYAVDVYSYRSGYQYRCAVTNRFGTTCSKPATLTVN